MSAKKKPVRKATTVCPRNAGTMTEAEYWSKIRSMLRKTFQFWKPMAIALEKSSRPYTGPNKLQKKEYKCFECNNWFKRTSVHIDHVEDCGTLKCEEDIVPFLKRLTIEDPSGFQILCKPCHQIKTNEARKSKKK